MIKKIKVKNFQAIGDADVDFSESRINYRPNMVTEFNIVNPSVFYGDNASGKTCFLQVFTFLNNLVTLGQAEFVQNYYTAKEQATNVEVLFSINEVNYLYKISGFGNLISHESLIVDELECLSQDNPAYKTTPQIKGLNATVESHYVKKARAFLEKLTHLDLDAPVETYSHNLEHYNKSITNFINDLTNNNYTALEFNKMLNGNHITYYEDKTKVLKLDYERDMSHGLKRLYHLVSVLFATKNNKEMVVIIDDLDLCVHPTILIKLMQNLNANFNAQIICSMHNTALMKYLRPDQIYFVTKYDHVSYIDRLNELMPKVREIHNVEKLYYGGKIPSRINEKYQH